MALISCPECGRSVSNTAVSCPQCGAPIGGNTANSPVEFSQSSQSKISTTPSMRKKGSSIRIVILMVFVIAAGYVLFQQRVERAAKIKAEAIQQAAKEAEEKRIADLRIDVMQNPNQYLVASDIKMFDKGIINDYRQLAGVTVQNRSIFSLKELSGSVDWLSADEEKLGSTVFSLTGSILPGDAKNFQAANGTIESGTIQSSAKRVRIVFEHVVIAE